MYCDIYQFLAKEYLLYFLRGYQAAAQCKLGYAG